MKKLVIIFLLLSSTACWALPLCPEDDVKEYGGLGIQIAVSHEDGFVKIISSFDATPARRAGIKAGDLIIRLNKKSIKGTSLTEVVKLLKGKPGSEITLTIVREGKEKPFDVNIIRDVVPYEDISSWHNCEGTFIGVNGNKYVGEFKDGKIHGQGKMTSKNGVIYSGEWVTNQWHGFGTLIMPAETTTKTGEPIKWEMKYTGEFVKDKRHGQGTIELGGGMSYTGEWANDKMHGQGTWTGASGMKHTGIFVNEKWHGQGTTTYPEGEIYSGEFKDGEMNGQGTQIFSNNIKYVGELKDNKPNGYGVFTYSNGFVEKGIWKNGHLIDEAESSVDSVSDDKTIRTDLNKFKFSGSGSGFAISKLGYIITNHHVIKECSYIHVEGKINKSKAEIISKDETRDLALLKVQFQPSLIFPIRQKDPEFMEKVFVSGFPFGEYYKKTLMTYDGIISADQADGPWFQTTATVQKGNSGGPITDTKGNIVGIAVGMANEKEIQKKTGYIPKDINYGIKVSVLKKFIDNNNIVIGNERLKDMGNQATTARLATYYISCLQNN